MEMQLMSQDRQDRMRDLVNAGARVLIASYFIAVALGVVLDPSGIIKHSAFVDMPGYLRWPSAGFELLAAMSILLGFQTRMSVALLALYVFWSSFIFNYVPGNALAIGSFWRDLAMIGGLLMLFAHGTGRYSIDYYIGNDAGTDADHDDDGELVNMADIAQNQRTALSGT